VIVLNNSAPHLFDVAWARRYGRGIIDCHYDNVSKSLSICDLSGLIVISDSSGEELERTVFDMPAWGVAHRLTEQGFIIACALADKVNDCGAVVLRKDSINIFRVDYESECWDVHLSDDFLYWTLWDGRCGRVRLTDLDAKAEYINLGASAYGISAHNEKVFAVAQGRGVFQVDDGVSFKPILEIPNANVCYNSVYDKTSSQHYTGSSGSLPIIHGKAFETKPMLAGSVCGIATLGDFLFIGTLDGELLVLTPSTTSRSIGGLNFRDGIWNLSVSHDRNYLYVACGDGQLYCLKIMENPDFKVNVQEFENAFENIRDSYELLCDLKNISEIVLASMILEERWELLSVDELKTVGDLLQKWRLYLSDDRVNYLLGLYFINTERCHDAIIALQNISRSQDYFAKSLMPLSQAFEKVGTLSSAIKILQNNLEKIPNEQVAPFLFRIGELCERCGRQENALQAYETLSYIQHSYPGLQDVLQRLTSEKELKSFTKKDLLVNNTVRITFEQVMEFDELNKEVYGDICKQYVNKNLVPFVGAGMSVLAGFPLWEQFLRNGYKKYSKFLGTAKMPSNHLRAASKLYNSLGRSMFNSYFEKTFSGKYSEEEWCQIVNQAQNEANGLLPKLFCDAIMTTNFDRFLERVYPAGTIITQPHRFAQLNRAMQERTTIIVKLHGCVSEPESIILTKESYDVAYPQTGETKYTIALEKFLANRTLLFLGCSLGNDATMKHLMKFVDTSKGMGIDHFAIIGCKEDEIVKRRRDLSNKGILAITYDYCSESKHDAVRAILQQLKVDTT
jgi:tetratricopeptide (TPR) repeat protein